MFDNPAWTGPAYPGHLRRKDETVSDFVKRLQLADLRKGQKNIFAPVRVGPHDPGAETRRRIAAQMRRPMPKGISYVGDTDRRVRIDAAELKLATGEAVRQGETE